MRSGTEERGARSEKRGARSVQCVVSSRRKKWTITRGQLGVTEQVESLLDSQGAVDGCSEQHHGK